MLRGTHHQEKLDVFLPRGPGCRWCGGGSALGAHGTRQERVVSRLEVALSFRRQRGVSGLTQEGPHPSPAPRSGSQQEAAPSPPAAESLWGRPGSSGRSAPVQFEKALPGQ